MKTKLLTLACVTSLFIAPQQAAVADAFADENFNGFVTFTSDYIIRGISRTDEDPAIQGSLNWFYNGFYAGVWASSIDSSWARSRGVERDDQGEPVLDADGNTTPVTETGTHSAEYDLYLGYIDSLGWVDYNAAFVYYWFPNDRGDNDTDWVDFRLILSRTFDTYLSPTIEVENAYTLDAALQDGPGFYIRTALELEVLENLGLEFVIGFSDVSGDKSTDGYAYTHYEFAVTTALKGFGLDLRYHTNNDQKSYEQLFGEIDQKLVFSVSRRFGG